MPIRNPQEIGVRRQWHRRYGTNGFPAAGGMNRQGRPGDVAEHDFWLLENARWDDPRMRGRGGQSKATTVAVDGCILGLIDIEESTAILVSPGANVDRYQGDQNPDYLEAVLPGSIGPDQGVPFGDPTSARRNIISFGGTKILFFSDNAGNPKVYEITFPPKNTPPDKITELTLISQVFDIPEVSSWVWKYEIDGNANSPTYQTPIPALYIGTTSTGEVYRWDGINLTLDTPASLGAGRVILCVYQNDIIAFGTDWATKRNYAGVSGAAPWDINYTLPAGTFEPSCAMEFAGTWFMGGLDTTTPANPAVILYLDVGTGNILKHQPVSPRPANGSAVVDLEVHDDYLVYAWTEMGVPSKLGYLGRIDASITFDDDWREFNCETDGVFGCLLSTGRQLFVTVFTDELQTGNDRATLWMLTGASWTLIFEYVDPTPPADMVAL